MAEIVDERYSFDISTADAVKNIAALAQKVGEYDAQLESLRGNSKKFEAAQADLAKLSAQLQGALGQEVNTLDGLKAKRDLLTKGLGQASIGTKEFSIIQKELNATNEKLSATTARGAASLDKFKQSISNAAQIASQLDGSFGEAIGKVGLTSELLTATGEAASFAKGKFGELSGRLVDAAKSGGIAAAAQEALNIVMKANPIGIIVAAIGFLVAAFSKLDPVVDKVEQVFAGLSAVFEVVLDRARGLATGIGNILTGNFSEGFSQITGSVSGMGDEMARAGIEAANLKEQMQDLEDAQTAYSIAALQTQADVEKLIIQSKNRRTSDLERIALLDLAAKKERESFAQKKDLQGKEENLLIRRIANVRAVTSEELDAIASGNIKLGFELLNRGAIQQDDLDGLIEYNKKRIDAQSENQNLEEKIANRRDAILEAQAAKRAKVREDAKKKEEEYEKSLVEQAARIADLQKRIADADAATIINEFDKKEIEINNAKIETLKKLEAERLAVEARIKKNGKRTEKDDEELRLIAESVASTIALYRKQLGDIGDAKAEALRAFNEKTADFVREAEQIAIEVASKSIGIEADALKANFEEKTQEIGDVAEASLAGLRLRLAKGQISPDGFAKGQLAVEVNANRKRLALANEFAAKSKVIAENDARAKIQLANQTLAVKLDEIEKAAAAEKRAAIKDSGTSGLDPAAQLAAIEAAANAKRAAAKREFTDAVVNADKEQADSAVKAAKIISDAAKGQAQNEEGIAKRATERRKEILKGAQDIALSVVNGLGQVFDALAQRADNALNKQRSVLDNMLSKSEDFNAGQIALERERLLALEQEQRKAAARARALQLVQVTANSVIAISKAAAEGGAAAPFTITATLIALAAGISAARIQASSAFFEGTDSVPLGKNKRGRDTVPAMLNAGEAVVSTKEAIDYAPTIYAVRRRLIPASILNQFIADARGGSIADSIPRTRLRAPGTAVVVNNYKVDTARMESKMDEHIRVTKEQTRVLSKSLKNKGKSSGYLHLMK